MRLGGDVLSLLRDLSSYWRSMRLKLPFLEELKVDRLTLATQIPGVFAGGDVATGPATVIEAIAAGEKAAASIKRQDLLKGRLRVRKEIYPSRRAR